MKEFLGKSIISIGKKLLRGVRKVSPQTWAVLQFGMGMAFDRLRQGKRANNLERAIAAYQRTLEIHTYNASPKKWAATQNRLADAYCERIRGQRADNLETAISTYEQALKVYACDAFPEKWAMTQNNLGTADRKSVV